MQRIHTWIQRMRTWHNSDNCLPVSWTNVASENYREPFASSFLNPCAITCTLPEISGPDITCTTSHLWKLYCSIYINIFMLTGWISLLINHFALCSSYLYSRIWWCQSLGDSNSASIELNPWKWRWLPWRNPTRRLSLTLQHGVSMLLHLLESSWSTKL